MRNENEKYVLVKVEAKKRLMFSRHEPLLCCDKNYSFSISSFESPVDST